MSRELGKAYPELGEEFALTAIELGFLTDRRQAFENLATRVDLDAVKGVVTTMIQTEKYGTPLASALRVLSAEFRNERMMRAEEKAARLPAIMTVPLILFILPFFFGAGVAGASLIGWFLQSCDALVGITGRCHRIAATGGRGQGRGSRRSPSSGQGALRRRDGRPRRDGALDALSSR